MTRGQTIIFIQPLAPIKPAEGQACNGCGVCCLAEPCPLGMALSHRRRGACDALRWHAGATLYRCGAMVEPLSVLHGALPVALRGLAPLLAPALALLARRMIAAGKGCDSSLDDGRTPPVRAP